MKKVKLNLVLLGLLYCSLCFGQVSVFDCQPQASTVTQNQIYVPDPFFYQRCIIFENGQNYVYDANSQYSFADIHIRAGKSICIEPGFSAGQFGPTAQGTGSFLMDIDPEEESPFDVAVMNYDNLEGVLRNDRFELGVQLPKVIQTAVDKFLLDQNGEKINPYLSWEIEVTADFYPVNNPSDKQTIHGFHYVPFERQELPLPPSGTPNGGATGAGFLELLGSWTEEPTAYPFRIRFAPPKTGDWSGQVHIKLPSGEISSVPFLFKVIPSNIKPPLNVGGNKRYLERGGESFIPFGNNLKWPRTTCPLDPELSELMGGGPSSNNIEQYRAYTPPVRTFRIFREQIDALADGGANLFRMIMAPQSNDIEFEKLGNYYDRQNLAFEMDDILYKAEERDVLIQWNMQVHYPYTVNHPYTGFWDWKIGGVNDPGNCYQSLVDVTKPLDFFKSENAKKYYKERLRYIISRWGYSNNIASFELFSEIDQIGTEYDAGEVFYCEYSPNTTNNGNGTCPDDPKYQINQQLISGWQYEMIDYMHDVLGHDKHLYQVDYAGKPGDFDNSFGIPNVDFITRNVYDFSIYIDEDENGVPVKSGSFDFPRILVEQMACNTNKLDYFGLYFKPAWFSETGPIPVEMKGCDNQIEMLRSQWKMLFSGVSGALDWESDIHQLDAYENFGRMKTFFQGINLDKDEWHPGNVDLDGCLGFNWKYKSSWNQDMVRDDELGDLMYLRKGNKKSAVGMITNTTYNYTNNGPYLAGDCSLDEFGNYQICDVEWDYSITPNDNLFPVSISDEDSNKKLKLRNMLGKKYRIDYYWAYDPNTIIHSHTNWGPKIALEYDMEPNGKEYIMLFKAYLENGEGFSKSSESPEGKLDRVTNDLKIFPNPTRGKFVIETNNPVDGEISVFVTDILGRVIFTKENIKYNRIDFDISNEKPGLYMVRVVGDGQEWVQSIVLQ